MTEMTLDQLLLFGISLIEALEIKAPHLELHSHSLAGGAFRISKAQPGKLFIQRPSSTAVASPVWASATLEIMDDLANLDKSHLWISFVKSEQSGELDMSRLSHGPQSFTCMHVGIFDAGDVHVFEYAMQQNESGVSVSYARAHEHLRGVLRVPSETDQNGKIPRFMKFDKPSEDIYYFSKPFGKPSQPELAINVPSSPLLWAWASPKIEIMESCLLNLAEINATSTIAESGQLKAAERWWVQTLPWSSTRKNIHCFIFMGVLNNTLELLVDHSKQGSIPVSGMFRATTFRSHRPWEWDRLPPAHGRAHSVNTMVLQYALGVPNGARIIDV